MFKQKKYKEKYCGNKSDVEFASMVRVIDINFRPQGKVIFKRRNMIIDGDELARTEEAERK